MHGTKTGLFTVSIDDETRHPTIMPANIRKVIYTTNAIESVHRQFRKLTKNKGAFPNENRLLKLFYLGLMNAQEKWTMPIQSWNLTLSQLAIYFEGRLNNVMTL
jgi:putative transposase